MAGERTGVGRAVAVPSHGVRRWVCEDDQRWQRFGLARYDRRMDDLATPAVRVPGCTSDRH
jgi:hypothetical protein